MTVCCVRIEDFKSSELFDGITSRAFTELSDFLSLTRHLMAKKGRWAAMKGVAEKELQSIKDGYQVDKIIALKVPKLEAARSLVVVSVTEQ